MKYFVKYKEWVLMGGNTGRLLEDKTRFFTTDDIEREWNNFKSLCKTEVVLVDVTQLGDTE